MSDRPPFLVTKAPPLPDEPLLQRHQHARELSHRSWAVLRSWLVDGYKLDVSPDHEAVLRAMLNDFAALTTSTKVGRIAYPLAPGMGKSQALLATITALHQLRYPYPVMVCASRAAALSELLDDLVTMGNVPEGRDGWGLLHSVPGSHRQASQGFDPTTARYLFQTHARVRNRRISFTDAPDARMVFWDESILISDSWSLPRRSLFSQIDGMPELIRRTKNPDVLDAMDFLRACQIPMKAELDEQEETGRQARPMALPVLDETDHERFKAALGTVRGVGEAVFDFLDIAHAEIRAAWVPRSDGAYITYHLAIPPSLTRIAVLDASYPVRKLCTVDKTISLPASPVLSSESLATVKTYDDTEVYIIKHGGGRTGIERAAKGGGKLFREIAQIIKTAAPDTEEWLLVVFKDAPHGPRHQDTILRALRDAGVPNLQRIKFVTWGMESSSNQFRDVPNSILVGIVQRSHADVYGSFIAQTFEWGAELTTTQMADLVLSEVTHVAYQAMHRTRMRKMVNGTALPTKTWIFYQEPERLWTGLRALMPGLQVRRWQNAALTRLEDRVSSLARQIEQWVNALPETVKEVKPADVKAAVCPTSKKTTFWSAFAEALPPLPAWQVVGRTKAQILIRKETT